MPVNPLRPRGPHLNALRAFEAAARLGGFAAAAEELSVTPGAVSQQIKTLEDWVGAPLFLRQRHGVQLTRLGESVVNDVTRAFDLIGGAVHRLRSGAKAPTIRIAALPSVAQLWLSPRLPAIRRAMPNVTFSVTALETPPNLRREVFDLSIFIRPKPCATAIEQDVIFPVCAPGLARSLRSLEDLSTQPLLHDNTWREDWSVWLSHVGGPAEIGAEGPVFSLYALALEEARNGAGLLMGHASLVERDLAKGTLVAPFPMRVATGKALALEMARADHPNLARLSRLLEDYSDAANRAP